MVEGTIRAAESIDDRTAVNLGAMERTRVIDAVQDVMRYTGHKAEVELHPEMPTGPTNSVADNGLAKKLMEWGPQVPFVAGLHRTIDWYFSSRDPDNLAATLEASLTER